MMTCGLRESNQTYLIDIFPGSDFIETIIRIAYIIIKSLWMQGKKKVNREILDSK